MVSRKIIGLLKCNPVLSFEGQCWQQATTVSGLRVTAHYDHYRASSSSSSSARWKARQAQDRFVKEAAVKALKSRAAFKLLQINDKHKIFKKGQTVVDLVSSFGRHSLKTLIHADIVLGVRAWVMVASKLDQSSQLNSTT